MDDDPLCKGSEVNGFHVALALVSLPFFILCDSCLRHVPSRVTCQVHSADQMATANLHVISTPFVLLSTARHSPNVIHFQGAFGSKNIIKNNREEKKYLKNVLLALYFGSWYKEIEFIYLFFFFLMQRMADSVILQELTFCLLINRNIFN